jgi:hypothetical protein
MKEATMAIRSFGIYVATAQRAAPAQPALYDAPLLAGLLLTWSSVRRSDAQQTGKARTTTLGTPAGDGDRTRG